ncbi:MAG TPA: hypothetical protein VGN52_14055 [Burkholderiales bacterium]|jgi:hypothetical protein
MLKFANKASAGAAGMSSRWQRIPGQLAAGVAQGMPIAGKWLGLGALLVLFPFFVGAIIALGAAQLDLLAFGAFFGLIFLFVPSSWVLITLTFLTFVVVGVAGYFLSFDKGFWLPYMICMLLYLKVPLEGLQRSGRGHVRGGTSPVVYALLPYLAVFVLSTLINGSSVLFTLVGAKNFAFIWSVLLLLALGRLEEKVLARIWLAVPLVGVLQLPFTLYQHFFVASRNAQTLHAGTSWDAVVGTFGGKIDGGGASGTLAVFEIFAILLSLLFVQAGVFRKRTAMLVYGAAFLSVFLAEVKVVFVLLPVVMVGVLGRRLIRNPVASLGMLAASGALLALLFVGYQQMYWSKADHKANSAAGAFDYMFRTDSNDQLVNYTTGEVSRLAAPVIWWRDTSVRGADLVLFGYGPSASRISETIGIGVAARRYSFRLDTSSLTVLLWDLGLIGLLTFVAILVIGAFAALRLAKNDALPPLHRAVMRAVPTAIAIVLVTLPYNHDAVDNSTLQLLICLLLGHVAYWHRRLRVEAAGGAQAGAPTPRGPGAGAR